MRPLAAALPWPLVLLLERRFSLARTHPMITFFPYPAALDTGLARAVLLDPSRRIWGSVWAVFDPITPPPPYRIWARRQCSSRFATEPYPSPCVISSSPPNPASAQAARARRTCSFGRWSASALTAAERGRSVWQIGDRDASRSRLVAHGELRMRVGPRGSRWVRRSGSCSSSLQSVLHRL